MTDHEKLSTTPSLRAQYDRNSTSTLLHHPLSATNHHHHHSATSTGLPKLIPRSAVTQRRFSPSPSSSSSANPQEQLSSDSDNEQETRQKSRGAKSNHLSMLDFLSAEPPDSTTLLPSMHHHIDRLKSGPSSGSSSSERAADELPIAFESPRDSSSKSFGVAVPRLSGSNSQSTANVSSIGVGYGSEGVQEVFSSSPVQERLRREGTNTNRDFLSADPLLRSASPSSTKGKRKSDSGKDSFPLVQLKVMPVTDSIIMFGSTQTSSNYSLSGKVVIRTTSTSTENKVFGNHNGNSTFSSNSSTLQQTPSSEQERENNFLFGETDDASKSIDPEEIRIRSLQVIFSGFALYVDHTGRFSAMRLANIRQELLSQGTVIPSAIRRTGQEYEIDFNLSVPGWLPSSLSTRFGGTFYCLEAKIEYLDPENNDRTSMATLIPPRNGSRAASPSPLSSSVEGGNSSYESDVAGPVNRSPGREENLRKMLTSQSISLEQEVNNLSSTPPSATNRKGSWLSKLQTKVSKTSSSPGPASPLSTSNQTLTDTRVPFIPPPLATPATSPFSNFDGGFQVQSKAKAIIIARCREVVPVPVARMAIIGPEGLPEGAHQDAPPTPRASSADATSRSRSSTITGVSSRRTYSPPPRPPPAAPSAFNAPSDPAKLAALVASNSSSSSSSSGAAPPQPQTPQRASSNGQIYSSHGAPPEQTITPTSERASRRHRTPYPSLSTIPMRHFLHRPMLHPPADAQISDVDGGLPFSLTLTLPSYVSVDGPRSDVLSFGVQIEVGRSAAWSKVRELGGLRLRDMELSCVQTERHSSVASRTFCHSYPLPSDPKIGPQELPIMETWKENGRERNNPLQQDAAKLRAGYDRFMVEDHMELVRTGRAPQLTEQNVERIRVSVVGPPTNSKNPNGEKGIGEERRKGKEREKERESKEAASQGSSTLKKARRRSMPASRSAPSGLVPPPMPGILGSGSGSNLQDELPALSDREEGTAEGAVNKKAGRGRRAYQSALRSLSNLATAVMDISLDSEGVGGGGGGGYGPMENDENTARKRKSDGEANQTAIYSFAGSDGHGVDLTRGRVRMSINLPLASSNAMKAKMAGTSRLVADFESPFIRVRHKLKVKLGFGFGSKPLGGEGDGNWGQALVMCVPVRFTDAAPREVREQFAPMPIAQVNSSIVAGIPSMPVHNSSGNDVPILPSYNQLFREDGSRLADEGEDLPQYPGRRTSGTVPSSGSVTAPSPNIGSTTTTVEQGSGSEMDEFLRFDNRITPSRVVDESLPMDRDSQIVSRQQQLELEEMQEMDEEEENQVQASDRMNETVNMEDMDDEFGEDDGMAMFSSTDQGQSGPEYDSAIED